jgi:hypothetical protein
MGSNSFPPYYEILMFARDKLPLFKPSLATLLNIISSEAEFGYIDGTYSRDEKFRVLTRSEINIVGVKFLVTFVELTPPPGLQKGKFCFCE